MQISKKILMEALNKAMIGTKANASTEGYDLLIFANGKIYSYNDEFGVIVNLVSEEPLVGAVKAADFYNVINKLKEDEIKIIATENSWTIKSKKIKAELTLQNSEISKEYIKAIEPKDEWKPVPTDLFGKSSFAKINGNKHPLSGIFIKENEVMSTDGQRINFVLMVSGIEESVWVPNHAFDKMGVFKLTKEYSIQKNWLYFKNDTNDIFCCKVLDSEKYLYDKLKKIMSAYNDESAVVFKGTVPSELRDALSRAKFFSSSEGTFNVINVIVTGTHIEVYSERLSGNYSEKVAFVEPQEMENPIEFRIDFAMFYSSTAYCDKIFILKGQDGKYKLMMANSLGGVQILTLLK